MSDIHNRPILRFELTRIALDLEQFGSSSICPNWLGTKQWGLNCQICYKLYPGTKPRLLCPCYCSYYTSEQLVKHLKILLNILKKAPDFSYVTVPAISKEKDFK